MTTAEEEEVGEEAKKKEETLTMEGNLAREAVPNTLHKPPLLSQPRIALVSCFLISKVYITDIHMDHVPLKPSLKIG